MKMKSLTLIISLMMAAIMGMGQQSAKLGITSTYSPSKLDTIAVIMLIVDTAHLVSPFVTIISCKEAGCTDTLSKLAFHSHSRHDDLGYADHQCYWSYGYSVREVRTILGSPVPDEYGRQYPVSIPQDIRIHKSYLDQNKQPLKSSIVVWQSKPIK